MKKRKLKSIEFPSVELRAQTQPESADSDERTVDAAFYTGAEVMRVPFFDDPFLLSFKMDKKAARLGRLNSGAPVLNAHNNFDGVGAILGVTSNARLENGEARATLRFSRRPDLDGVWQDVQDGIVRNLSMGVIIHAIEELEPDKKTGMARLQATDWEPKEISVLGVGADPGAQIRLNDEGSRSPCTIHFSAEDPSDAPTEETMEKIKVRLIATGEILEIEESEFDEKLHSKELEEPKKAAKVVKLHGDARDVIAEAQAVEEALENDKQHLANVKKVASAYALGQDWVTRMVNLGLSMDAILADATQQRASRSPKTPNNIGFGNDYEAAAWKQEQMAEALAARATGGDPPEPARQYARWSFVELAYECLAMKGLQRGLDVRSDRTRIFDMALALHTTSDFPLLLANALNKVMLPAYENAMPTYRQIAARRNFNDFRAHHFLRKGDFPDLLKVNENGEFKYGTLGESDNTVTAATFGRILGLTRQTLINDDVGAFQEIAVMAGMRVSDFENALFYSTVIAVAAGLGPNLSDGVAVYNGAHNNLTGAGALDVTRLGEARALLRKQTSIDGLKLNTPAAILLVSADSETTAEQLTSPLSRLLIGQGADAAPTPPFNPFAGTLRPIADSNLTGTRFYVLADPSRLPNYIYGFVGGAEGPRTQVREGFTTDGVEFKVALDFGVGAVDFRGGVTGAGA